jgi:hypothetical protein
LNLGKKRESLVNISSESAIAESAEEVDEGDGYDNDIEDTSNFHEKYLYPAVDNEEVKVVSDEPTIFGNKETDSALKDAINRLQSLRKGLEDLNQVARLDNNTIRNALIEISVASSMLTSLHGEVPLSIRIYCVFKSCDFNIFLHFFL